MNFLKSIFSKAYREQKRREAAVAKFEAAAALKARNGNEKQYSAHAGGRRAAERDWAR